MAEILIPTPLRKFSGNQAKINVSGETIDGTIRDLVRQYPELGQHLLNGNASLQNFVRVFLGDSDIRDLQGLDTPVKPGDSISIIPAIAGGIN